MNKFLKENWLKVLIILLVVITIIFIFVKIENKIIKDKRTKAIIDFCEEYKWIDRLRNQDSWDEDGKRLIGKSDFLCSEHLYLKPKIKKSSTGICHDENSTYYYRTKIYKIFDSMDDCLKGGGRRPYN